MSYSVIEEWNGYPMEFKEITYIAHDYFVVLGKLKTIVLAFIFLTNILKFVNDFLKLLLCQPTLIKIYCMIHDDISEWKIWIITMLPSCDLCSLMFQWSVLQRGFVKIILNHGWYL